MKTWVKITGLVGITAVIVYGVYASRKAIDGVSLKVVSFGFPRFSNAVLSLPIVLEVNNSTIVPVPIDSLQIDLNYKQGNNWIKAGQVRKDNFTVAPGKAQYTIEGAVNLKALFNNIIDTLVSVVKLRSINIRADIALTVKGITVNYPYEDTVAINIPSLGLVPNGKRTVTPVPAYLLKLVPQPTGNNENLKDADADPVRDTVPAILRLSKQQMWQGKKLAQALRGNGTLETVRNDWNFMFNHIQYKKDDSGKEQLRSLRRLVHEGKGDCDCFVNALSNLLKNQNIPHKLRVAKYDGSANYSHIYIIVPDGDSYITLDPVVHQFNYEVPTSDTKDFTV